MAEYFPFFPSFYEAASELPNEEKNALLCAILEYGLYQREPELSGAAKAVFIAIKPTINASLKRSQNGKKGGRPTQGDSFSVKENHAFDNAKSDASQETSNQNGCDNSEETIVNESENHSLQDEKTIVSEPKNHSFTGAETQTENGYTMEKEKEKEREKEKEKAKEKERVREREGAAPNGALLPAQAPPTRERTVKHGYGEYGWVKLADGEYAKLCADLGEDEVKRCIRYIDESAQSSQNKNRWKDWNLVVRRCSREGWGKRASPGASAPKSNNPFLDMLREDTGL